MFSPTPTSNFGIRRGLLLALLFTRALATEFDVRAHGATSDGQTLDTAAINRAIAAASAAGGGTVRFPAGTYLSFSIRLKSNLPLHLDAGATLLAATPSAALGGYDAPEPNEWGDQHQYQDFGHSHWHNSLIWGENLENFAIIGPGRIDGSTGLVRNASYGGGRGGLGAGGSGPNGSVAPAAAPPASATVPPPAPATPTPAAIAPIPGNKAIALKNCRNVTLRDISLLLCGHFALLANGVDHLTLDNVKVDTNRDGFDIDACRHVRIADCSVNAPGDDAIVLKSSFALGFARACENVTIANCSVTGFDAGTFFDGTYKRTMESAADRDGPTGRIKFGTESNGGFKNITISYCTSERSRGLALETVDGGVIDDITITNITMRDIVNAPIFLRLGNRARGPAGTPIGAIRRVLISNVTVADADPRYPSTIAGLPGHPIEGHRQKRADEGQTFKKMLGQKLLPETFNVYCDPARPKYGATELGGHYLYDNQGVKAQRVPLIESGVFTGFLMARIPIDGFPTSNGHGRKATGASVVSRQSNLIVETTKSVSPAVLKEELRKLVFEQKKPYGLLFDDIQGGFAITGRTSPNAFNVQPIMVDRIFPDDREELFRGADFTGTPLSAFSKITAADNAPDIFNGVRGAESGWVPVSAVSPSLLLSQVEVQKKEKSQERLPIFSDPAGKS